MTTSDNGTATLLLDGRVLIVGFGATSPEIFDPRTGKFTSTGPSVTTLDMAPATQLVDGRVIFAGGSDGTKTVATAQIYDPATGKFTATGSLNTSRMGHTATLLLDGRVLIAGGSSIGGTAMVQAVTMAYRPGSAGHGGGPVTMTGPAMLASAEIYDPKTGKFTVTGSMTTGRDAASATLLTNGRVLIVGGGNEGSAAVGSAEIYDPKTGKFSRTGAMLTAGYGFTSTLLPDGRVLISAGNDGNGPIYSLEIYDPKASKFSAAGTVGPKRGFYTSALLADGRVLISGGYDTTAPKTAGYLATCELYDPATGKVSPTGSMMAGRLAHSATTLLDGRVLVAGGVGGGDPGNLSSAELYQP
jgi:N-acetylneuraminic acid mutarotase